MDRLRAWTWAASPAVALGVIAGHWGVEGAPAQVPVEAHHWLPWFVLVGTGLSAADAQLERRMRATVPLRFLVVTGLLTLVLAPLIEWTWTRSESVAWVGGLSLLWTVSWGGSEALSRRVPAYSLAGVLALTAGGVAALLGLTGSLKMGLLGLALALSLAVVAVAGLAWRDRLPARGLVHVAVPPMLLLLTAGVCFSETPALSALALGLAPLVAIAGRNDRAWFPWRGALAGAALAVGVVAVTAWAEGREATPAEASLPY